MRLLVDANLSWRLVCLLESDFSDAIHLANTTIGEVASDTQIWDFAKENEYTIITNDDDFNLFSLTKGFPPKIVLPRTGNQSTQYLAATLRKHKVNIESFVANEEYGVLEIF